MNQTIQKISKIERLWERRPKYSRLYVCSSGNDRRGSSMLRTSHISGTTLAVIKEESSVSCLKLLVHVVSIKSLIAIVPPKMSGRICEIYLVLNNP